MQFQHITCLGILLSLFLTIVLSEKSNNFPFRMFGHFKNKYMTSRLVFFVPTEKVDKKCDDMLGVYRRKPMYKEFSAFNTLYHDVDRHATGVDNGTLYEYIFLTLSGDNYFQIDRNYLKMARRKALEKYISSRFNMHSEYGESQNEMCVTNYNQSLPVINGTRGCVFMQRDIVSSIGGKLTYKTIQTMPTSMSDVLNVLKPFKNASNFNEIFDAVLKPSELRIDSATSKTNKCTTSLAHMETSVSRLILCIFEPQSADASLFANIKENEYFCPNTKYVFTYIQTIVNSSSNVFYNSSIDFSQIKFQKFCRSIVNVQPIDYTNKHIEITLTSSTDTGIVEHNTSYVDDLKNAIHNTCPFAPKKPLNAQNYSFIVDTLSDRQFVSQHTIYYNLSSSNIFGPCFFQQHNEFYDGCTMYVPYVISSSVSTGGLRNNTYKIIRREKGNSYLVLMNETLNCVNRKTPSQYLAFLKHCFGYQCDSPQSVSTRTIEKNVYKKVCTTGSIVNTNDDSESTWELFSVGCYFKISIDNDKPSYDFGVLTLDTFREQSIIWKNVTFFQCITLNTDENVCVMSKNTILCCCTANEYSPCNNRQTAQNKLATSRLRSAVKCSTVKISRKEAEKCNFDSSQPRICISVFKVAPNVTKPNVSLARELCDLEVLRETRDDVLAYCHAQRYIVMNNSMATNGCDSVFIHDLHKNLTLTEAKNRVISCCSPEYYEDHRARLEKKVFKTIGDFLYGT